MGRVSIYLLTFTMDVDETDGRAAGQQRQDRVQGPAEKAARHRELFQMCLHLSCGLEVVKKVLRLTDAKLHRNECLDLLTPL